MITISIQRLIYAIKLFNIERNQWWLIKKLNLNWCADHYLNLFSKDIFTIPIYKLTLNIAKLIVSSVNNNSILFSLFKEKSVNNSTLKTYSETRFNSVYFVFESIVKSESILKQIAIDKSIKSTNAEFKKLVLNDVKYKNKETSIFNLISEQLLILTKINQSIGILESFKWSIKIRGQKFWIFCAFFWIFRKKRKISGNFQEIFRKISHLILKYWKFLNPN